MSARGVTATRLGNTEGTALCARLGSGAVALGLAGVSTTVVAGRIVDCDTTGVELGAVVALLPPPLLVGAEVKVAEGVTVDVWLDVGVGEGPKVGRVCRSFPAQLV